MNSMSSCYIKENPTMIAKCWNCHTEFEIVSSAADTNKLTAQSIAKVLRSNIFDASRGTILVNVNDLIDEIAEVLEKNWKK